MWIGKGEREVVVLLQGTEMGSNPNLEASRTGLGVGASVTGEVCGIVMKC